MAKFLFPNAILPLLEELYSGVLSLILVYSISFGQQQRLDDVTNYHNVASVLQICLVQLCLVVFYMHWLKPTSNSCIHIEHC